MNNEVMIMNAKPEDALGITTVLHQTWLTTYPNAEVGITIDDIEDRFKDVFSEESLKERADSIANLEKHSFFLVAKIGEKVVGICRANTSEIGNRIRAIYVLPEYQGQGIGKKMAQRVFKLFDPTKDTLVDVASYNIGAIEFYKSLGFKDEGKRFSDDKFTFKSGSRIPEMEMVIRNDENGELK